MEEVPAINESGVSYDEGMKILQVRRGAGQHPLLLQRVYLLILLTGGRQRAILVPSLTLVLAQLVREGGREGGRGGGREGGREGGGREGGREGR